MKDDSQSDILFELDLSDLETGPSQSASEVISISSEEGEHIDLDDLDPEPFARLKEEESIFQFTHSSAKDRNKILIPDQDSDSELGQSPDLSYMSDSSESDSLPMLSEEEVANSELLHIHAETWSPTVHTIFRSKDLAQDLISQWAAEIGFTVRKRNSNKEGTKGKYFYTWVNLVTY